MTQVDALGCVGGRVRGTLMFVYKELIVMSVHLSLNGLFHYGGKSELIVLDDTMNQQVYRHMLQIFYHGQKPPSITILSWSKILLLPTQPGRLGISLRTRMWKSWTGHPKVRIRTPLSTYGTIWWFKTVTWIILKLRSTIVISLYCRHYPSKHITLALPDINAHFLHVPGNYTGVATPDFFGVESHSSHPRPWHRSGIVVSSSYDD